MRNTNQCSRAIVTLFGLITACWMGAAPIASSQTLPNTLSITVDVDGSQRTLNLYKRSIRGTDHKLYTWTTAGGYQEVTPQPQVRTYRGTVVEEPNMVVTAVIYKDGTISVNALEGKIYQWQIKDQDVASQLPSEYVNFRAQMNRVSRVKSDHATDHFDSLQCGCPDCSRNSSKQAAIANTLKSEESQRFAVEPPKPHMPPSGGIVEAGLGVDLNQYWHQRMGGDLERSVAECEHLVNTYDLWMCRDTLITIFVPCMVVRIDEYYDLGSEYSGSGSHWRAISRAWYTEPLLSMEWDMVYTERTANGFAPGVGGVAWGGRIGKDEGAYDQSVGPWCINALFHENGHNWSASHLMYGLGTMGGNNPHHGPVNIEKVLSKRTEKITESSLAANPEQMPTYADPLHPYAHVDLAGTLVDTPIDVDVLANDWDANGDALSLRSFSATTKNGGAVSEISNGVLRYTPPTGYVGKDLIAYEVQDSTGLYTADLVHIEVVNVGSNPVAHYEFEDLSGSVATDSAGGDQPGGLLEATFERDTVAGVVGDQAIRPSAGVIFDNRDLLPAGVDSGSGKSFYPFDLDTMDTGNAFDPMDHDYTVAFWFKLLDSEARVNLIQKEWHSEQKIGFKMYYESGAVNLTFRPFTGLEGSQTIVWDDSPIVDTVWYDCAMVIDRSDDSVRLFIDGVEASDVKYLPANAFVFQGRQKLILGKDVKGRAAFDDARVYTRALSVSDIGALLDDATYPASRPVPAHNAIDIPLAAILSWTPGDPNYTHNVYFGTDEAAVAAATPSTLGVFRGNQSGASFDPARLELGEVYHWRIDEVAPGGDVIRGDVWKFSTLPDPAKIHDDLAAWWKFDDMGADSIDVSGNGHHAPRVGGSLVAGVHGTAFEMEPGNHIEHIPGPSLNVANDFTISAWVRTTDDSDMIFYQRSGDGLVRFYANLQGNLQFDVESDSGPETKIKGGPDIRDGVWRHVLAVRAGDEYSVYLNGERILFERGEAFLLGAPNVTSIGREGSGGREMQGAIDDLRVWNRALNSGEIKWLAEGMFPVQYDLYRDISGGSLIFLEWDSKYPDSPDESGGRMSMEGPQGIGDDYGQRMRSLVVAPETGSYRFYIASDDDSELRLSTDESEANASLIAEAWDYTGYREWDALSSQESAPINLVAGNRYFIEALHKEGGGGDHVSVGWSRPSDGGAISVIQFPDLAPLPAPVFDPFQIPAALEDGAVAYVGFEATLAVRFSDENSAHELTFAKLSGPGWVTVTADGLVRGTPAPSDEGANVIQVRVTDNTGRNLDATYTIDVVAPTMIPVDYWFNTSAPDDPRALLSNPGYPDGYTNRQMVTEFEAPSNQGDFYNARMHAWLVPPTSGDYTFWIASNNEGALFLSTDDNPANKLEIAEVDDATDFTAERQFDKDLDQQSAPVPLEAGKRYFIEALVRERTQTDHLSVAWSGPGISQAIIPGTVLEAFTGVPPRVQVTDGGAPVDNGAILDMGQLPVGAPIQKTLEFENIGDSDLVVSDQQVFGFGEFNEMLGSSIAPSATDVLIYSVDSATYGFSSDTIRVSTNDPNTPIFRVIIHYTGTQARLAVADSSTTAVDSGTTVELGEYAAGVTGAFDREFAFENEGNVGLSLTSFEWIGAGSVSDSLETTLAPGESDVLRISVGDVPYGASTGTIRVTTNDPAWPVFEFTIRFTGTQAKLMVSDANTTPLLSGTVVDAGERWVGARGAFSRSYRFSNLGNTALQVFNPRLLGDDGTIVQTISEPIPPGESDFLIYTVDHIILGVRSTRLRVESDDPDAPVFELEIQYIGVTPPIEVKPEDVLGAESRFWEIYP